MDVEQIPRGAVVVAVQGEQDDDRPLRWGAREAVLQSRPLVVVHVDPDQPTAWRSWTSPAYEAAQLARGAFRGLEVHDVATIGDPRRVLLRAVREARLLVLGSRGRGVLRSMLSGSVSAAVSSQAACPVVVLRPGPESAPDAAVVIGVDESPGAAGVVEFGFAHAARHDRPVVLTHCFWDVEASVGRGRASSEPREELALLLSRAVAGMRERYPDVAVRLELDHGLLDPPLEGDAALHHLLVVGRHPVDTLLRRVTGSKATAVLEHAHTAVAVVPESADDIGRPTERARTGPLVTPASGAPA